MVLVCGGTQSGRLPQTLCRPPEIGSSAEAQKERTVSRMGSIPGWRRARASMNPPER